MRSKIFFSTLFLFFMLIFQTVLNRSVNTPGIHFEAAFLMCVFLSVMNGSFFGVITGLFLGLFSDFTSLSPFGFNAIIYTLTGYTAGKFQGKIIIDTVLMPIVIMVAIIFIKRILAFILALLFNIELNGVTIFQFAFYLNVAVNIIIAPFIVLLLLKFKPLQYLYKDRIQ